MLIHSVLIDLASVVIGTKDVTVNKPGMAPVLMEIVVLWRKQIAEKKKGIYAIV